MWQVLSTLGGLGMGLAGQSAQAKQQRQQQLANALETQYSPWLTPNYQDVQQAGSRLGMGLGGAMQGYMFGQQFGKKPSERNPINLMNQQQAMHGPGTMAPSPMGSGGAWMLG